MAIMKKFSNTIPLQSENTDTFISKVEMMFDRWTELAVITKGNLEELRDLVIRDQLYRSFNSKAVTFLKERSPKSIADVRDMAAKYRSAYPDISLAREEISIGNVAEGPTGKDRDARTTMRDKWNPNVRGGPMFR
ncbi:hypothetical protein PoB_003159700 [Plakobranchus ocellatus]|uniref:Uncharacterized protein n=1 Tax=Plakobranchus ocellatus TaxID=259542 RepID=A0AAV4ACU2_9GAST|nr:hypothetical protein PoB_003159700 [Plakobranchus ocellatus]